MCACSVFPACPRATLPCWVEAQALSSSSGHCPAGPFEASFTQYPLLPEHRTAPCQLTFRTRLETCSVVEQKEEILLT